MRARTIQDQLRAIAVGGVLLFVIVVVVEHLADRSLHPATHEISEYVHGRLGWLMTVGFVAWTVSLAATGLLVGSVSRGKPVGIPLLVAAIGIAVTACFATQTSAGRLPPGVSLTAAGRLHDFGSGLATVALLAAALLSLRIRTPEALRRATGVLLAFALPADALLLALGSDVAGVRQRLLVAVACAWQLTLLDMTRTRPEPLTRSRQPGAQA